MKKDIFSRSINLLLMAMIVLVFGFSPGLAAPTNNPQKPVLTKSGKKAALAEATATLLAAPSAAALAVAPDVAVPHYYGPWPNWANSPFTVPNATVTIASPASGTTATATATVGLNGAVTGYTITNPGSGYTSATPPLVTIGGAGNSATADAVITDTNAVVAITLDPVPGDPALLNYTAPLAEITDSAAGTGATATVYGGVYAVIFTPTADVYTFPTVDFDLPDNPDGLKAQGDVVQNDDGTINSIVVTQAGSGYSFAPKATIRDGFIFKPVLDGGPTVSSIPTTLELQSVVVNTYGANYTAPTVAITDTPPGLGPGTTATASIASGIVSEILVNTQGSGYLAGGIKKFVDGLPGVPGLTTDFVTNNLGQHIPIAVPDTTTFPGADYYVIAVVQHRECMSSSFPGCGPGETGGGTLVREYVQLATGVVGGTVPLYTQYLNGSTAPTMMPGGLTQAVGIDEPHFLGPLIVAQKDRPVRITFYNLLPDGVAGDLFMPKDSTIMGSGYGPLQPFPNQTDLGTTDDLIRNPVCTFQPSNPDCFKDNRATLHLHGGITPWISDGTPHQWITPASEGTPWPEGVSVGNVPDMVGIPGVPDCSAPGDGCQTFYYTNQQSARLMFYHDHAWGITRLNVYAGEAAGYLIQDPTEDALVTAGTIPVDQIPLVIQDRTFVPGAQQLSEQDPLWDMDRWGGEGNFWYHHVYMPAQNPDDPSGMSAYGRWMYGPWFWPPATPPYGPINNPYYDPNCNLNDPLTWTYQTDPFCEPQLIPGTPNISVGMEQFNDTPIVNGTAYPTVTVQPKAYRLRILNAANDRFFNLSLYEAESATASSDLNAMGDVIGGTEVALNAAEVAAAQLDPNIFPTPDTTLSPAGPDWIYIGSEGGFLPAPVVIPAQPTTWVIDPTVFNVGNVDKHSLLIAPAERADVIVDFSAYAGKTLILYNDAPAAFPARVSTYDYYTGAPDQYPVGASATLPGYGPNTRTVMQIKVAAAPPADPFDLAALETAFAHDGMGPGMGAFESGQHPIIVGQAGYNSAYGTNFVADGYCNGGSTSTSCDGMLRIADQGGTMHGFNTLDPAFAPGVGKLEIPIEPKAIHDEMNSSAFDEFGRMQANLGVEATPATPVGQNIILYPYTNPPTELWDATNLPKNQFLADGVTIAPISEINSADGTQIWKITHNGVDTHPIHWHLYDVQVLNRVTWDNIVSPPDPTELGWKDTLRVSPLEDTIVAIRPVIPKLPWELPNSTRPLHPMTPIGETLGFNNVDANGNPTNPIVNSIVNFGFEYVWHCHILSHEEMDMMRPQAVALPPSNAPDGVEWITSGNGKNETLAVSWNDNSLNETKFVVQRNAGGGWVDIGTVYSPLDHPNTNSTTGLLGSNPSSIQTGLKLSLEDPLYDRNAVYQYRVVAQNTIGYGNEFMSVTAEAVSDPVVKGTLPTAVPAAPTSLTAELQAGPQVLLTWTDNATTETGFNIERSVDGVNFSALVTVGPRSNTGPVSYTDTTVAVGPTYTYRVAAVNLAGFSTYSNTAVAALPAVPAAPSSVIAVATINNNKKNDKVTLTWTDVASETGYTIQMATNASFTANLVTSTVNANTTSFTTGNLSRYTPYYFRVQAFNGSGPSTWTNANPIPINTP